MKSLSLLEFFHPDGYAQTSLVIGENCPEILLSQSFGKEAQSVKKTEASQADLIVLAPGPQEYARPAWMADQVLRMAGQLGEDGVGYVIAPPRIRLALIRQLADAGLSLEAAFAHLPNFESSQVMVPFNSAPLRYAVSHLLTLPGWKKRLLRWAAAFPGTPKLLAAVWPWTGLAVRCAGARPLFSWLTVENGQHPREADVIVRASWRGPGGSAVLYRFSPGARQPAAVAKILRPGSQSAEEQTLQTIGTAARQDGVRVPRLLRSQPVDGQTALLQTNIPGQPGDDVIRANPARLNWVLDRVVTWLEGWHRRTASMTEMSADFLQRTLLTPAALLAPFLANGEEYLRWLENRCGSLRGRSVPLVSAHQDLTLANILIDQDGSIGIIDWESAQPKCWPLMDFYYFLTDAVMTAVTPNDRLGAFKACFTETGARRTLANKLHDRLIAAAAIDRQVALLCFHACWLHHARNEHNENVPVEARSFLPILQWLASHLDGSNER